MSTTPPISVARLRAGIILFFLWWLPAYLLAPTLTAFFGDPTNAQTLFRTTVFIMLAQTVIGLIGLLLVGKELVALLRHQPKRQVPKALWQLFWSGTLE